MIKKNYLFIIVSIILGIIISYYYNPKFDKKYFMMFTMISIISYILFYFLGNINQYENFIDKDNKIELEKKKEKFNFKYSV
jgi:Na+/melibiose symporter-like transporter